MSKSVPSVSSVLPRSVAALLWRQDAPQDVRAYLDDHLDVRQDKEAVLDLAYEEYCRLLEADQVPDLDDFCARFPTYRDSLRRVLEAYDYLRDKPQLLDGETSQLPAGIAWPMEGETFLGFRLLRELGRGAFARVFLAAEPDLGDRLVAVKISPYGSNEAQTLGRIDHPNVVKVYTVRQDKPSGLTAVCMPYLGAATLDGVLSTFRAGRPRSAQGILDAARAKGSPAILDSEGPAPQPLPLKASYVEGVCWLGAQLADALAFLHRRNIFHRDLKPSNVLMRHDGRPMLLDFNLSADPRADRQVLGGTLPYMSPEQVRATFLPRSSAVEPVDARSDLYSLGVILFELLTGRLPFGETTRDKPSAEECESLLRRQLAGAPALRQLCPEATLALADVVARCLAFDRSQRPVDAAEVAAALRRDLAPWRRGLRRLRRHPWKLAGVAVLFAATALAGFGYLALRPSKAERLIVAAEAAEQRGDSHEALRLINRSLAEAPTNPRALVLSGRLYQSQGRYGQAVEDFRQAILRDPDPRTFAALAYCLGMTDEHTKAISCYKEALDRGFTPAEVAYNNRAYHHLALGEHKEAAEALSRAGDLPAAQHNRLILRRLELRLGNKVDLAAIRNDLNKAFEICPQSAELFGDAADLCAVAGQLDPAWNGEALNYLEEAVQLGLPLGRRTKQASYKTLRNDPRFIALETVSNETAPGPSARLIDPSSVR